jgi:DNA polymerase-3 subunit delta
MLHQIAKPGPAPVYLLVGPEVYTRRACRRALIEKMLTPEAREEGFTRHDLAEIGLDEVIDDARSMSLFARDRVIWVSSAEEAVPRTRGGDAEENAAKPLDAYVKDPTPGVVLVFDSHRFDMEGEDKAKLDRVRKFFAAVPAVVEFPRFTPAEARALAMELAGARGLQVGGAEIDLLVEATAAEPERLAVEIEKLALYRGTGKVSAADISALVPDAKETTIFALVNALARGDRRASLGLLDTLVREGEYLPLALTFLGGIFRMALAAREQKLRSSSEVQNYFQRQGTPMWRSRAEQIYMASTKLSREKLEEALKLLFEADRDMKGPRPDDRVVMERFVLRWTG